ncbi:hypothetical protein L917_17649 [Phytophthora nicotianae]|uniref:Uncharacterized protein n=3 Tax=Phytophthora nicotianae TaxID=4792 RepID=W2PL29_PHYN3|nr:hypothetical protein PPTG_17028 [Phytophthora nicotianae INRA-310]ETL82136.1 hypothetical protein L917_17649 [Phytophthora nicotianae]ETN01567.1 hypothetical protein PPTG_17028 [Phytophthora nicotianae INRA-310]KUF85847.1 hypothetical protein AM587_10006086 [Phytophthora nicotianae]
MNTPDGWVSSNDHERLSFESCEDDEVPEFIDEYSITERDADVEVQPKEKKKRIYKKRKTTYAIRKEEKMALESQIRGLMAKINVLQLKTLLQQGGEDHLLHRQLKCNAVLRNNIQEQHLAVARVRAMLTGSTAVRPTKMYIHLPADPTTRQEAMKALREPKLYYARQFITQLCLGLHPTANYFNEERFDTPEGDYCNVRFDRTSLKVSGGVRAVYEALQTAVFNTEIILSEASGNITIREDDDIGGSQLRLVAHTTSGLLVENNLVHFSEFSPAEGNGSYALTTVDYVDRDDRFPYRPHERIRRDAMSIVMATSQSTARKGGPASEEDSDTVVVITRWTFTRICRTELNVPSQVLRQMRDVAGQVSDTLLNCVRETVVRKSS